MDTLRAAQEMTYHDWELKYKPILDEEGYPKRYETYGPGMALVKANEAYVWTVVDLPDLEEDDEESSCWLIIPGIHLVNRLDFFICEIPHEDADIEVRY